MSEKTNEPLSVRTNEQLVWRAALRFSTEIAPQVDHFTWHDANLVAMAAEALIDGMKNRQLKDEDQAHQLLVRVFANVAQELTKNAG